ncbi:MAG: ADP-ribosylation factor-like protein [Candidatus Hodarchaeota archaeon]
MSDEEQKLKKILYTGLENSGKSSLILCLRQNISNVGLLKPTYLVDRSKFTFMEYDIIQHDMGGQKSYLINYLNSPGKFFKKTDLCVFVIDIQDEKKYDRVIEYFGSMLEKIDEIGANPPIKIFFHKAENILDGSDETGADRIEKLKDRMIDVNKGRFSLSFKMTTICDPWGISTTFSEIFNELWPRDALVKKLMKKFADELGVNVVVLLDGYLLTIASHISEERFEEIIKYTAPHMYLFRKNLDSVKRSKKKTLKLEWDHYEITFVNLDHEKTPLYLLIIAEGKKVTEKDLDNKIYWEIPKLRAALRIN